MALPMTKEQAKAFIDENKDRKNLTQAEQNKMRQAVATLGAMTKPD